MQLQRQATLGTLTHEACSIIGYTDTSHEFLTPALQKIIARGDLGTEFGSTLFLPNVPDMTGKVLLVHCGKGNITPENYRKILQKTGAALKNIHAKQVYCTLTTLTVSAQNTAWKLLQAGNSIGNAFYKMNTFKTNAKPETVPDIAVFLAPDTSENDEAIRAAQALVDSMRLVKNLGNLPANICTPTYLADQAIKLSTQFSNIKTEILEETDMEKLGMHSLLSVSRGSRESAKLICLYYQGAGASVAPLVFIGKGVTFDAGGISLKPAVNLDEMKYDMCGGATVLGVIQMAAQLKLPLNITGIVPAVENMPDGKATRPGDIVKSLSGQTIEILNTDAEGRLILCDALTYAERFQPDIVIDIATLTGSIILTFGNIATGIMGNDQTLIQALLSAANTSGDRAWELPLWEEYHDALHSHFADVPNIANHNNAKAIIAGCFLSRFTQKFRWAHLDIAGSAFVGGKEKGATGRPLPLLLAYLLNKIKNN